MTLSLLTMLSLTPTCEATEVGLSLPTGIGLATGYPGTISVTGAWWVSDKGRIAGYLGSVGFMHGIRALYEHNFYPITDEGPGVLWLYWFAGIDVSITRRFNQTLDNRWYPRIGVAGGAGIELQFHKVPAEVFFEIGPALYPVNSCSDYIYASCFPSAWSQIGARWYF